MTTRPPKTCLAWSFGFRVTPRDQRRPGHKAFFGALNLEPAPWTTISPRPFGFRDTASLKPGFRTTGCALLSALLFCSSALAGTTNSVVQTTPLPLPDVGLSLIRVLGALAVVLGIFLGGVWLFRNWQRLTLQRGRAPRLNVVEVRSLGGRHALYVVGYEQERFLLASSPAGVNLLSHLPAVEDGATVPANTTPTQPTFAQTLTQMLKGK